MAGELRIVEEAKKQMAMHPKKFALWLFMVSVIMVFGAFTSAYIVRQAEGNWMVFDMPSMFWFTTGVIMLSSVTMHWAYRSVKRDNNGAARIAMAITLVLGICFLAGQWLAWGQLLENGIHFVNASSGAISGSFLYVISGLHGLHIVSGMIFLAVVMASVFQFRVHSQNSTQVEMCATYWHFLDGLWLYLFVFLLLNR